MSILNFFSGKTVALLGTEMMTGMLLLQRLLLHTPAERIIVFVKTKNNSFDSKPQLLEESKMFKLLGLAK